jgi:hypothetical protein
MNVCLCVSVYCQVLDNKCIAKLTSTELPYSRILSAAHSTIGQIDREQGGLYFLFSILALLRKWYCKAYKLYFLKLGSRFFIFRLDTRIFRLDTRVFILDIDYKQASSFMFTARHSIELEK